MPKNVSKVSWSDLFFFFDLTFGLRYLGSYIAVHDIMATPILTRAYKLLFFFSFWNVFILVLRKRDFREDHENPKMLFLIFLETFSYLFIYFYLSFWCRPSHLTKCINIIKKKISEYFKCEKWVYRLGKIRAHP